MKTKFIAICFGYWGRGDTESEALTQLRKAGGKRRDALIYKIEYEDGKDDPYVTGDGTMVWYGTRTKVVEFKSGHRKEVKEVV